MVKIASKYNILFFCVALFALFFYFPILFVLFMLFITVISRYSGMAVVTSFLIAFTIALLVSNFYFSGHIVGDVVRYSDYYHIGAINDYDLALRRFKVFQWGMLSFMNENQIIFGLYSLISLFIIFFIVFYVPSHFVFYDIRSASKLTYFFVLITLIPWDIIYNFEYMLGLSFIILGLFLSEYNNKLLLPFLLIGVLCHNGVLVIVAFALLSLKKSDVKFDFNFLVFYLLFFVFVLYSQSGYKIGIAFIDYFVLKFSSYFERGGLDIYIFIITLMNIILLYSCIRLVGFFNLLKSKFEQRLSKLGLFVVYFSPLFLMNSVFSQRFIIFMMPFFSLLFYRLLVHQSFKKIKVNYLLFISLLLLSTLYYGNLITISSFIKYVDFRLGFQGLFSLDVMQLISSYEK